MTTRKNLALTRSVVVLSVAVGALALIGRTPVLEAQGRPDLEAQYQRLLPLFEQSGVVYTDADEARGRLVVGILNRNGEGQVQSGTQFVYSPIANIKEELDLLRTF